MECWVRSWGLPQKISRSYNKKEGRDMTSGFRRYLSIAASSAWGGGGVLGLISVLMYTAIWTCIEPLDIPTDLKFEIGPRWKVHVAVVLFVAPYISLVISSMAIKALKREINQQGSPQEQLPVAIVKYARLLADESKDSALISLRNSFSPTLHLLGLHKYRYQLGALAINSANILRDNVTKVEILVDDLGWARYLQSEFREEGLKSIARGVEEAKTIDANLEGEALERCRLAHAKGLRHLAVAAASSEFTKALGLLEEAEKVLSGLEGFYHHTIVRDKAQLAHAKALIIAKYLRIEVEGYIRSGDAEGLSLCNDAIRSNGEALDKFEKLREIDRYVKSCYLQARLLHATFRTEEGDEMQALASRALSKSEWIGENSVNTFYRI